MGCDCIETEDRQEGGEVLQIHGCANVLGNVGDHSLELLVDGLGRHASNLQRVYP